MIVQGSNEPIIIEFDFESNIKKVNIALFDNSSNKLKSWSFTDKDILDNVVIAPLSETETMNFPDGIIHLEVKWLDDDDVIWNTNVISVRCSKRDDKSLMLGGDINA